MFPRIILVVATVVLSFSSWSSPVLEEPCLATGQKDFTNTTFVFKEAISSGTDSVEVLDELGTLWVLKGWRDFGHGATEIVARVLINEVNDNFYVYKTLPPSIKQATNNLANGDFELFLLSPFIETDRSYTNDSLAKKVTPYFVMCSLLSFWDIKRDNLIIDSNDVVHFIDLGGSFFYYALGDLKTKGDDWSPSYVSDFKVLGSREGAATSLARRAFSAVSDYELRKQLASVLARGEQILGRAETLLSALKYSRRSEVLNMLAHRLNHLSTLHDYLAHDGLLSPNAQRLFKALPHDAAGTLLWARDERGQPKVLLGKRAGRNWWANLGGKAEPEEYLYQTARRETREESGGLIDLSDQIEGATSHDLVEYRRNERTFSRYRMYLVQIEYRPAAQFTGLTHTEHEDYEWVFVSDLFSAIEGSGQSDEKTPIFVDQKELYPPFVLSLRQEPIKQWLRDILAQRTPLVRNTQGLSNSAQTGFGKSKSMEFSCPENALLRMSLDFLASSPPPATASLTKATIPHGASHHMLNYWSKKEVLEGGSEIENIQKLYDGLNLSDTNAQQILSIIDKEKSFPEHYVLYHGLQFNIWFTYRVMSYLRHILDGTQLQTDVLRVSESKFKTLGGSQDLINFIASGRDNYSPGFRGVALSCNPTLFSNRETLTSSTLHCFLEGKNYKPVEFEKLLRKLFAYLDDQLAEQLVEKLVALAERHNDTTGALLQFFIPEKSISDAVYVCGTRGRLVYENQEVMSTAERVFSMLRSGQEILGLSEEHVELQARLHAHLTRYPNIRVFDYFNTKLSLASIDDEIKKIFASNLPEVLQSMPKMGSLYTKTPTLFQSVVRACGIIDEYETIQSPAAVAFFKRDVVALKGLLQKKAIYLHVIDPDTLKHFDIENTSMYSFVSALKIDDLKLFEEVFGHFSEHEKDKLFENFIAIRPNSYSDLFKLFKAVGVHDISVHKIERLAKSLQSKKSSLIVSFIENVRANYECTPEHLEEFLATLTEVKSHYVEWVLNILQEFYLDKSRELEVLAAAMAFIRNTEASQDLGLRLILLSSPNIQVDESLLNHVCLHKFGSIYTSRDNIAALVSYVDRTGADIVLVLDALHSIKDLPYCLFDLKRYVKILNCSDVFMVTKLLLERKRVLPLDVEDTINICLKLQEKIRAPELSEIFKLLDKIKHEPGFCQAYLKRVDEELQYFWFENYSTLSPLVDAVYEKFPKLSEWYFAEILQYLLDTSIENIPTMFEILNAADAEFSLGSAMRKLRGWTY
jgi:8-oxo-dGTP pyrophosphatase MutT (NUDIX family)